MTQLSHASRKTVQPDFRNQAMAELDAVYRFALHLCRNAPEAEDLVQETYLKAFKAADSYDDTLGTVRPWLYKILHNIFLARRRRSAMESRKLADIHAQTDETPAWADPTSGDHERIDWEHVDDQLKQAIHDLPDDLRATFLLFAAEDLAYRQIADVLDVPIGTVMSRLSRARRRLIETLRPEPADENKAPALRIVKGENPGAHKP